MNYLEYSKKHNLTNSILHSLLIIVIILFFSLSCSTSKRFEKVDKETTFKENEQIRVLLSESKKIKISFENEAEIIDNNGRRIFVDKNSSVQFILSNAGIKGKVNDKEISSKDFLIVPKSNKYLQFNENKYRGYFKIVSNSSFLMLINYLDIENYVKGVILKEMPLGKGEENFEAIKAFSILARTYAVKRKLESRELFDLYSDTKDQVYGGLSSENEITNSLVDFTKGHLLFYKDNIATVFYHSTCGGYTENVENVFKSNSTPYLISIVDNIPANCIISPRFDWEESFSENLIIKRLLESNYISDKNSKIRSIDIISRFKSGRVNELKITLFENKKLKEVSLFSNNIRFVLRNSKGSILPSSNFEIQNKNGNTFIFKGKGFGHGVGMCQWGSIKLSREGTNFKEILKFYFPKTEIKKIYD